MYICSLSHEPRQVVEHVCHVFSPFSLLPVFHFLFLSSLTAVLRNGAWEIVHWEKVWTRSRPLMGRVFQEAKPPPSLMTVHHSAFFYLHLPSLLLSAGGKISHTIRGVLCAVCDLSKSAAAN